MAYYNTGMMRPMLQQQNSVAPGRNNSQYTGNPNGAYNNSGYQQSNLGRYRPPSYNPGPNYEQNWNDQGGYEYNIPNSYGGPGNYYSMQGQRYGMPQGGGAYGGANMNYGTRPQMQGYGGQRMGPYQDRGRYDSGSQLMGGGFDQYRFQQQGGNQQAMQQWHDDPAFRNPENTSQMQNYWQSYQNQMRPQLQQQMRPSIMSSYLAEPQQAVDNVRVNNKGPAPMRPPEDYGSMYGARQPRLINPGSPGFYF